MEPRDRPTALATKTGIRDGAKPEFPGTNATPTFNGRVNAGVPGTVVSSRVGYRKSAALVTFRAVLAHPPSVRDKSRNDTTPLHKPLLDFLAIGFSC